MLQWLHFVTSVVFHIGFNCYILLHVLHIYMLIVTFHYICCTYSIYKFVSTVTFFCICCICSNCYILLQFMFYYILLQLTICNIYYNFIAKTVKMVKQSQSCVKHQKFQIQSFDLKLIISEDLQSSNFFLNEFLNITGTHSIFF